MAQPFSVNPAKVAVTYTFRIQIPFSYTAAPTKTGTSLTVILQQKPRRAFAQRSNEGANVMEEGRVSQIYRHSVESNMTGQALGENNS